MSDGGRELHFYFKYDSLLLPLVLNYCSRTLPKFKPKLVTNRSVFHFADTQSITPSEITKIGKKYKKNYIFPSLLNTLSKPFNQCRMVISYYLFRITFLYLSPNLFLCKRTVRAPLLVPLYYNKKK